MIRTAWDAHYADAEDAPVLHPDAISAKRRMLRGLYPPTGGSYWGGVGPDALTAKLISDIEEDSGQEFLAQILTSPRLSPRQRRHCLTILGRAVASHPELADSAASAVASHAELLRRDAEDLLATLPDRARDVWQRALAQAQREPEASHAQAELRDGQQEPERHPAPGAGASLTRPDRTTPELPPTPDDDTAPAPPPSAPQGLPPSGPRRPCTCPLPRPVRRPPPARSRPTNRWLRRPFRGRWPHLGAPYRSGSATTWASTLTACDGSWEALSLSSLSWPSSPFSPTDQRGTVSPRVGAGQAGYGIDRARPGAARSMLRLRGATVRGSSAVQPVLRRRAGHRLPVGPTRGDPHP